MKNAGPSDPSRKRGIRRREFLKHLSRGAVAVSAFGPFLRPETGQAVQFETELEARYRSRITLRVNHRVYHLEVPNRATLLEVLRGYLGLTGTKEACNRGQCGACTVILDGRAVYACSRLAVEAQGSEILTIEGLERQGRLDPLQQAFIDHDAMQCGYCIPGQIMAARALLNRRPRPEMDEIRSGLAGNLCRCGSYPNIWKAVASAAEKAGGGT